jgi:hypothetical protein
MLRVNITPLDPICNQFWRTTCQKANRHFLVLSGFALRLSPREVENAFTLTSTAKRLSVSGQNPNSRNGGVRIFRTP